MTVPFARVPDNLRVGLFFVEFDNSMANNATATQRTLLIGGMLSTGSTLPGIPQRVSSSDTVGELTGKGGILQAMMAALRVKGKLWCRKTIFARKKRFSLRNGAIRIGST